MLLLLAALLAGCATRPSDQIATPALGESDRFCAPYAIRPVRPPRLDPFLPPDAFQAAAAPLEASGFSRPAIEIAEAIGALRPLQRLAAMTPPALAGAPRREPGLATALARLRLRQAINDRVTAAALDVSATLAELDCEGERGDQIQALLQAQEDRRSRRLTLASILAGALTAGVTGGLSLAGQASAASIAGIVGGASEASLGGALLLGGDTAPLRTERNLLREVWERPEHASLFPETVWRYLMRERTAPAEGRRRPGSVADVLEAEWRSGDRLGAAGSAEERHRTALLFGEGGDYTLAELEIRESLLELVQASVALMNADLRVLVAELQTVFPAVP